MQNRTIRPHRTKRVKEGIIVPFHADPGLVRLVEEIAAQHPELAAYPAQINGGNTEMADALRLGIPAITIGGQTRAGDLPHWHQVGDTTGGLGSMPARM